MAEINHRKRLTREESRERTRDLLIEAARASFVDQGIEASSIEEVAESAGFSRGAFYSNFESKDDLVCAVLEREIAKVDRELQEIYAEPLAPWDRMAKIRDYYIKVSSDPQSCLFWMEMQLYALRASTARPRIAQLLRNDRANVVKFLKLGFAEVGLSFAVSPEILATSLIAQSQGLTLAQKIDPESISNDEIQLALGLYFDRMIGAPEP